jgi:hypothetical protein
MGKIVLSGPQNVPLDGVVQDPTGDEGFGLDGWFVQFGGKDLGFVRENRPQLFVTGDRIRVLGVVDVRQL